MNTHGGAGHQDVDRYSETETGRSLHGQLTVLRVETTQLSGAVRPGALATVGEREDCHQACQHSESPLWRSRNCNRRSWACKRDRAAYTARVANNSVSRIKITGAVISDRKGDRVA